MRVLVLGAGCSRSYAESPTGQPMPLARDVLQVFGKLRIARNPWVLTDAIKEYARSERGVPPDRFLEFNEDIEQLHSEVQERLLEAMHRGDEVETLLLNRLSNQLVFLFASTINEIQNGPISAPHRAIARSLLPEDVIVTFNWDTLMDRALTAETPWKPDFGYSVVPKAVFRGRWTEPQPKTSDTPLLLKLHGSTNWLTSYPVIEGGRFSLTQASDPSTFFVYDFADAPYATYAGRYMPGYQPFSYGYYPPNLTESGRSAKPGHVFVRVRPRFPWMPEGTADDSGLVSMPLIIPPVKEKTYEVFGKLFAELWQAAGEALVRADQITVIGYSFPRTDHRSNGLFATSLSKRSSPPRVRIIDPLPLKITQKFVSEFGVPEGNIEVVESPFSAAIPT